jgi:hypothetical protein
MSVAAPSATSPAVPGGVVPTGATAPDRAQARPPLDDIMLAMDVVDTLRRRERLVHQELDQVGREQDLKERLRKIYAAQGIEVPDRVIEQGVAALKEERFVYKPPPEGLATRLARLYVSRGRWGKWVAGVAVVPMIAWGGHWFVVGLPNAALPDDLAVVHAEVVSLAKTDDARQAADQGLSAGLAAVRAEDTDAARKALRQLEELRTVLDQEYTLRIVNRAGERSGVFRVPDVSTAAANYYIVVEGIDATGEPATVPIKSEETGKTERVSQWGLRVDQATYNAVGRDKADDGIIERDRFGVKRRGYLTPDYEMKTTGGAITRW